MNGRRVARSRRRIDVIDRRKGIYSFPFALSLLTPPASKNYKHEVGHIAYIVFSLSTRRRQDMTERKTTSRRRGNEKSTIVQIARFFVSFHFHASLIGMNNITPFECRQENTAKPQSKQSIAASSRSMPQGFQTKNAASF